MPTKPKSKPTKPTKKSPSKSTRTPTKKPAPAKRPISSKPPKGKLIVSPPQARVEENEIIIQGEAALIMVDHGLRIVRPLTLDEWRAAMRTLKATRERFVSVLADLIRYGRETYGDDEIKVTLEQLEFAAEDEQRALALGQLTLDFRSDHGLTTEHYYVLSKANLDGPGRERWAIVARNEGLTANELKHSIEKGTVVRQPALDQLSGTGTGTMTIQGVIFGLRRWEKKVGGEETILMWPIEQKRQLLEELKPVADLARKIEESL
jgi:hypothetical protein